MKRERSNLISHCHTPVVSAFVNHRLVHTGVALLIVRCPTRLATVASELVPYYPPSSLSLILQKGGVNKEGGIFILPGHQTKVRSSKGPRVSFECDRNFT